MESILEQQRSAHEETERLEQAIVDEYMKVPKLHKERLLHEHRVSKFLDRIGSRSQFLFNLYEDKDHARKQEIDALSGANEFSEFYARLKSIKDYHRRYPNEAVEPLELEFMREAQGRDGEDDELEMMFSGEEGCGKFLDLHSLFEEYINLPKNPNKGKIDYLHFLANFDDFGQEEGDDAVYIKEIKKTAEYKTYLENVKSYLETFFERAKPLYNLRDFQQTQKEKFDSQWEKGKVPGWEKPLGAEEDNGTELFCPACQKQYTKQTVYDAHLNGKKHINAAKKLLEQGVVQLDQSQFSEVRKKTFMEKDAKNKEIAWLEILINKYADILVNEREATKSNVERKQALTDKELKAELEATEEPEVIASDDEDEDDDKIYNPLKLPLGWDGKPIPYWLYKLHGLGVEYPCEICGNYVYMGRKAFDKHFQEWRHAHGMRCLGIPNTRQFHEITLIEDAYALWERQKASSKTEEFEAETAMEFEDTEGNVYNLKTFQDLKRQGLL